ncbi:DUF4974 domain-containing protein [Sphingobacterium bovistauri]|uniref:DUF4974 domain-containing protein n=1 Tax=Sphingobacterium bovistauri TaxID=2781959 RepID=A0ABS7Z3G2_9SPHI|nr:DUF4974 domain-containing protein [Sphingobacterium bovistauri]MCA5004716.1 DUF4974 domain-containing protein [Sphingobacterium bovistauri]
MGQSFETKYSLPLRDVLSLIEKRYNVVIKYNEDQIKDKNVDYGLWRFRANVDETLTQVLSALDLKVNKEGEGKYKLKEFEYFRWKEEDGWQYLQYLGGKYNDKTSWEKRKDSLRTDLFEALKLSPIPTIPNSKPILTKARKFHRYTVQNFALEIMPGLFVNGSIYRPIGGNNKKAAILSPDGHWGGHRYRNDAQIRCAMIAQLGAVAISYDLFAWGESLLQFRSQDHRRSLALTVQTLSALRILDFLEADKSIDSSRIGICGGSGGGNHSALVAALDDRIKLSIPVASLSSYHFGGCPCESGLPIHFSGSGTNNVEIAAMTAPRPQLIISNGKDWTAHAPLHDVPYLKNIYSFYNKSDLVENVHFADGAHDFSYPKRKAVYDFITKHFKLDNQHVLKSNGDYDESKCTIEDQKALYAFGENGELIPSHAIYGYENLEKLFK